MANPALQAALKAVLAELQKADGAALKGGMKAESEPGTTDGNEGPEIQECQECAAGTCTNPDHMDDAALDEMAEGY